MITLNELVTGPYWRIEIKSKEPGHEWFKLSFEVAGKTVAECEAQMIALREELAALQKSQKQRSDDLLKGLNEICDVIEKHQKEER